MTTLQRVREAPASVAAAPCMFWPGLIAVVAALVRLPFATRPLSPDEGGYLLVASQWSPGSSVYGSYFVDRPPLLIALFGLADELGGALPLRLLGLTAVVVSVLLAGRLAGTPGALLCTALLSTPLFDGMEIDGEILAVPFVLGAFTLLIRSVRGRNDLDRYAAAFVAGLLAAAAALVKQNMVDGPVVGAVLLVGLAAQRQWWEAVTRAAAFAAGVVGTITTALTVADVRGTGPRELWDALVTFRAQAAAVINASAASTNGERFHTMLLAGLVAGVPMVVAAAFLNLRRPVREPLLVCAAIVVLVWEVAGAMLGGSYWLHYLIALVPGLVLLTTACGGGRWLRAAAGYTVAFAGLTLAFALMQPVHLASDAAVAHYIREESRPGDTMVVAFGHANIVEAAGMQSPYENLWSLSARVRDPQLADFDQLIGGSVAPRWIVVSGDSLATWGIDSTAAQATLDRRYHEITSAGDWHVFERR
jgi:hypothetical protein